MKCIIFDVSLMKHVNTMKIIESNIIGKKSQEACEDGLVMTDDFIAVIDGSTSKKQMLCRDRWISYLSRGRKGGIIGRRILHYIIFF